MNETTPPPPNVQLYPKGDELSLWVRPGTAEAEVVSRAIVAGLQGNPQTARKEWAIRGHVMTLNQRAHKGETQPVLLEDEAADIALEGLFILAMDGREARRSFTENKWLTDQDRTNLEPGIENTEMWGQKAEGLQELLLDQSVHLGRARRQAKQKNSADQS